MPPRFSAPQVQLQKHPGGQGTSTSSSLSPPRICIRGPVGIPQPARRRLRYDTFVGERQSARPAWPLFPDHSHFKVGHPQYRCGQWCRFPTGIICGPAQELKRNLAYILPHGLTHRTFLLPNPWSGHLYHYLPVLCHLSLLVCEAIGQQFIAPDQTILALTCPLADHRPSSQLCIQSQVSTP